MLPRVDPRDAELAQLKAELAQARANYVEFSATHNQMVADNSVNEDSVRAQLTAATKRAEAAEAACGVLRQWHDDHCAMTCNLANIPNPAARILSELEALRIIHDRAWELSEAMDCNDIDTHDADTEQQRVNLRNALAAVAAARNGGG